MNSNGSLISFQGITKIYQTGKVEVRALDGINLNINRGELVAVTGPSGSGKSTLMNIMGCLDQPTNGVYNLDSQPVAEMTIHQLASIRNRKIGFIFQNFNLLSYATAYENVEMPLIFAGKPGKYRKEKIMECLSLVGLADRADHKPTELSGGEMQRVAIARSLANEPDIILADEPTGNLDSKTGMEIIDLFEKLNEQGKSVVTITHDMGIARRWNRIIKIKDGVIETDINMGR
ncbi:MAG: ABC transporter ATP-binding protein [candidate division Zixibacteria bacterium]|nr:ABC transporter ATP-binding protein [candidate division Zixibacteria bacterium]